MSPTSQAGQAGSAGRRKRSNVRRLRRPRARSVQLVGQKDGVGFVAGQTARVGHVDGRIISPLASSPDDLDGVLDGRVLGVAVLEVGSDLPEAAGKLARPACGFRDRKESSMG